MNRYRVFGIASVALLAIVLVTATSYIWGGAAGSGSNTTGTLTQSGVDSLNVTAAGVSLDTGANTIYINESADLPVMMGPMNAASMYSFEILGLINPEIIIHEGVHVHFTAINIDDDSSHNFVLSSQGPPYGYMGGPGLMGGVSFMSMINYMPPVSGGHYSYDNFTYTFSHSGTYWYLCSYPGHAEKGMYGEISVAQAS